MRDQIIALLSQGLKQAEVSAIVGCDSSYISQLAKEADFMAELLEARSKTAVTRVETKLERLEESVINRMDKEIEFAELPVLCKVLDTINTIRRSKVVSAIPGQNANKTVKVAVSVAMIPSPSLDLNSQNEVVAINGVPLAAMPSAKVAQLFQNMRAQSATVISVEEIIDEPAPEVSTNAN